MPDDRALRDNGALNLWLDSRAQLVEFITEFDLNEISSRFTIVAPPPDPKQEIGGVLVQFVPNGQTRDEDRRNLENLEVSLRKGSLAKWGSRHKVEVLPLLI